MPLTGKTLTWLANKTSFQFTKPLWNMASRSFANGARGTANVFVNPTRLRSGNVWINTERSILRFNGIGYNYHFVY